MNVARLIKILEGMPQDVEVMFKGYSCGSTWHASVQESDVSFTQHMETDEHIVEINAEWN